MNTNITYLISCSGIFLFTGICYFLSPWLNIPFLGFEVIYLHEANVMRGYAGLYIGISFFWMYSIRYFEKLNTVILFTIFILSGDSFGRLLSCILDGFPQFNIFGTTLIEISLAISGYYLLQKEKDKEKF